MWVRWWWAAFWSLPSGHTSEQPVLAHPVTNLVVQNDDVVFAGPTTQLGTKELAGTGWAVGAALHPAAIDDVLVLNGMPTSLVECLDRIIRLQVPALFNRVSAHIEPLSGSSGIGMETSGPGSHDHLRHISRRAAGAFSAWMEANWKQPTESGLLATRLVIEAEQTDEFKSVERLADDLSVSSRTLQRVARSHLGMTPASVLRRGRLQWAAERIRHSPTMSLAEIAAQCGYSDQAHLARDFRSALGFSPSEYRQTL